jgi:hypothetical protein
MGPYPQCGFVFLKERARRKLIQLRKPVSRGELSL